MNKKEKNPMIYSKIFGLRLQNRKNSYPTSISVIVCISKSKLRNKKPVCKGVSLLLLFLCTVPTGCGDLDGNIYLPFYLNGETDHQGIKEEEIDTIERKDSSLDDSEKSDSESYVPADTSSEVVSSDPDPNCNDVPWGNSCKTGNRIYNLTFSAAEASTRREITTSFEELHCLGYNSVIIVAGDAKCSVCPAWYKSIGERIDNIHKYNSAVVAICTDNFGQTELAHITALQQTELMQPDYASGSNPLTYPCDYDFTPFTMVVNLRNATVMDKDSTSYKMSVDTIIDLISKADSM